MKFDPQRANMKIIALSAALICPCKGKIICDLVYGNIPLVEKFRFRHYYHCVVWSLRYKVVKSDSR